MNRPFLLLTCLYLLRTQAFAAEATMLSLPGEIDFARLPMLKGTHAVVCPPDEQWAFQLHNYLLHHEGKFWCMWSAGPKIEDWPTQHVRYATSADGMAWSKPKPLTGLPDEGRAYIARDFWVRDGQLLGLAASYRGHGAFGVDKDLKLVAFTREGETWKAKGVVYGDAINNYAPQRLSTGEWMMARRDANFNVSMLIGGTRAFDDWRVVTVVENRTGGLRPDEPIWWEQPDGLLIAALRDNGPSDRLFRSTSDDRGVTWSAPERTNYPNARSKAFSLRTSRGFRVLISNANPVARRREMHLAISEDGLTFARLARLDIPAMGEETLQYPHAVEHDDHLWIVFSRRKTSTELFKVSMNDLEALRR